MSSAENLGGELPMAGDLKVEVWPIDRLVADPKNYRGHPPKQIEQIAASLKGRGFRKPIVVQETTGMVIAGHGLLEAAKSIGLSEVAVAPWDCSDQQARAFLIADNELSRMAIDDDDKLNRLLKELSDEIEDPQVLVDDGIGFDLDEILDRMDQLNRSDLGEDEVIEPEMPDLPKDPITKVGDVWKLGVHRLICGDSTRLETYTQLLGDVRVDMVFTDPPYGVGYEQGKFTGADVKKKFAKIANDELRAEDLRVFIEKFAKMAFRFCHEHAPIYVCSPSMGESFCLLSGCVDAGFHMQSQIIWCKNQFILGRADYHWRHEIIWYGYKGKNHFWCGDRTQDTIWNIKKDPHSSYVHPTQKPVALSHRAILNSSRLGSVVLDGFLGGGGTLLAAEQTGRVCYGIELDPAYCDVIVERWEGMTGERAEKIDSSNGD